MSPMWGEGTSASIATSNRHERPALNHVVAKSSHARGEPDDGD